MWHHRVVVLILALGTTLAHNVERRAASKSSAKGSYKMVCYYGNWAVYRRGLARFTPQNINPFLCTHIIYAFGGFSNSFELKPFDKYNDIDQGNYKKFIDLKKYNPKLKTMLAIGGWNEGSARFSTMVASEDNRERFVRSAVRYMRTYGFDGLDLDWEYPTFRDGSDLEDRVGYANLIKELREAFDNEKLTTGRQRLLLTIAVPAGQEYIDQGYDVPVIAKNVDFMNLLTYDYHTSFEPAANHHSPLYRRPDIPEYDSRANLNVDWTVKYYLELGVPASKIVVGIPTYGRGYTLEYGTGTDLGTPALAPGDSGPATREGGYMAYYEICQKILNEGWIKKTPYPNDVGPYAHKDNQWVGYDDVDIVRKKAKYIKDKKLGGAMFWSLDNDDFRGSCGDQPNPLITAVRVVLMGKPKKESKNDISSSKNKQFNDLIPTAAASTITDTATKPDADTRKARLFGGRSTATTTTTTRRPKPTKGRPTRSKTTPAPDDEDDEEEAEDDEFDSANTPPTPPTPDPGPNFECKDSGFYPNPVDCKKYFWCLDSGPANLGLVAHAFTCPSGLYFSKSTDACDYPNRVRCKVSATPTTPVPPQTTTPRKRKTTKRTTTTTESPESEEEESPAEKKSSSSGKEKTSELADLLRLIQQLGGIDKVQSHLGGNGDSASHSSSKQKVEVTTPKKELRTLLPNEPKEVITTTASSNLRAKAITSTRRPRGKFFDDDDPQPSRKSSGATSRPSVASTTDRLTRNYITIRRTTTTDKPEGKEEGVKKDQTDEPEPKTEVPTTTTTTEEPTTPAVKSSTALTIKPRQSLFRSTAIRLRTTTATPTTEATVSTPRVRLPASKRRTTTAVTVTEKEESAVTEESVEDSSEMRKSGNAKWRPTHRVITRKRRPSTTEVPDIETTHSRISTTIQKAPPQQERRAHLTRERDSDISDATNAFHATPLAASEDVLDIIPGEGRTRPPQPPNQQPEPQAQQPVFITQFTAGQGSPQPAPDFRPFFESLGFTLNSANSNNANIPTTQQTPARTPFIIRPRTNPPATRPPPPLHEIQSEEEYEYEIPEEEESVEAALPPPTPARPSRPSRPVLPRRPTTPTPRPKARQQTPGRRVTTHRTTTTVVTTTKPRQRIQTSAEPEDVTRAYDPDTEGSVIVDENGRLECDREGIFEHPIACNKFINCVRTMNKLRPWTYTCPPGLFYDEAAGHCNWQEQVDCGKRRK